MVSKYETSLFFHTRTHRLSSIFRHHLSEGVWVYGGKGITYSNCPTNHKIVVPYESFMWEG